MIFTKDTITKLLVFIFFIKDKFRKNKGAILIEFSFAIPILIMILYFSLDVPLAYRISARLQKTSELYAQMLSNISKNQDLTIDDLKGISNSIGLTFKGTLDNKNYPFNLSTYITLIKGNDFEIQWCIHIQNNLETNEISSNSEYKYSTIYKNSEKRTGSTEKLAIQKDEKKILIETVAWYEGANSRGFNKGFYLLAIPGKKNSAKTWGDKIAILTPDDDLIEKLEKLHINK